MLQPPIAFLVRTINSSTVYITQVDGTNVYDVVRQVVALGLRVQSKEHLSRLYSILELLVLLQHAISGAVTLILSEYNRSINSFINSSS